MKRFCQIAGCILLFFQAGAWDHKAHRIIAQIAKSRCEKPVVELVDHYLQGMTWEDAACWMDSIKSNPKNDFMKTWHYVNIEKDKTYVRTKEPDVINQIEFCMSMLQRRSLLNVEVIATQLKNLFHLTGDIHQPLHCGYASDKGGNLTNVKFRDKPSNLHRVWDSQIIEDKGIDIWDCSKLLLGMTQKERQQLEKIDITGWATESRSLLGSVYGFRNSIIDQAYIDTQAPVVTLQLTKAGIRLASILNQIFKE
jgi:hypothetical protein